MSEPPELNYVAIKAVARFAKLIPIATAVVVLPLVICGAEQSGFHAGLVVGLLAALVAGCLARLLVEIVVVLADTLLPR